MFQGQKPQAAMRLPKVLPTVGNKSSNSQIYITTALMQVSRCIKTMLCACVFVGLEAYQHLRLFVPVLREKAKNH
jgi:hypothetical protein